MLRRQVGYRVLLVSLAVCPMVGLACSGDDDGKKPKSKTTSDGSGGSSTSSSGSGGTDSTATTSGSGGSGGTASGGSGGGSTSSGGTGGTTTGTGGATSSGGSSASGGSGGFGGSGAEGGVGAEGGMGGEGGAPPAVNLLTNGDFNAFMEGWQNEPDAGVAFAEYAWGQQGISHWSDSAYAVSTYQTIEDVPDGTYSFSIYAISGGGFDDQYLFARGYDADDPDAEMKMSFTAPGSGYTEDNKFTLSGITVTSGTVTVGFHSDSNETATNSWSNFDNAVFIRD